MQSWYALAALSAGLAAAATSLPINAAHAPAPAADSVAVTAAYGLALVPVRIIARQDAVLSTSGRGSWSGDTLRTRTPLVLTLAATAATVTVQAIGEGNRVRVTLNRRDRDTLQTAAGALVLLRTGPHGWKLSTPGS